MMKKTGFTLIELMIVVAIIAIIAAIAIPGMIRAKMSANEAAGAGNIRTLSSAQAQYQTAAFTDGNADGTGDYGTLANLANPLAGTPGFIDEVLGLGTKQGYSYTVTTVAGTNAAPTPTYTAIAAPTTTTAGVKRYFVDESGVVRFTANGTAPTVTSIPLAG